MVSTYSFEIDTFEPEDGLDALKVLEEAAELQVAFKIWGGNIKEPTYPNDYYHMKMADRANVEDELADVIIACVNFANKHKLDIQQGLNRKNFENCVRGYVKKALKND